jgi:hypothetical protein
MQKELAMNETISFNEDHTRVNLIVSKEFYEADNILLILRSYSEKYFLTAQPVGNNSVEIVIQAKDKQAINDRVPYDFINDLTDMQLKIDLQKEFSSIRNKIIDYTFSVVG